MTIALTCTDCGHTWQHQRRRGPAPARCTTCKLAAQRATRLTSEAHARGLSQARAVFHDRHGWVCMADDAILRDAYDIEWFQIEHTPALAVAA